SLRVNHKKLESGNKNLPPRRVRHQQFGYIERQRKQFLAQGNPIISIDAKKKGNDWKFQELRGWLGEAAAVGHGSRLPQRRQRHGRPLWHLRSGAESRFRGGGTSHEIPAFAVDAVTW